MSASMMLSEECKLPDTQVTLERLWAVMKNPDSSDQLDRQQILLETYLAATGDRITVADLQLVARVISFLGVHAEVNSRYTEPLQQMFHLLELPPIMGRASDEIQYSLYLAELLNVLGNVLLDTRNVHLKSQILSIFQSLLVVERSANSNMLPLRSCVKAIEVSDFVESLADLMAIIGEDMYHQAVYSAFQICQLSGLCCWKLLMKNALESLCVRLTTMPGEVMPALMNTTCGLLWKLLKCTKHSEDWRKVPVPSRLALRSLRYVLREAALVHAHPGRAVGSLNNMSAIILQLVHLFPGADYVLSGLIEDIAFFATVSEVTVTSTLPIVPYFKDNFDHLQFKKLMLACLAVCPVSTLSVTVFERCKLAQCLVTMIEGCLTEDGSHGIWCFNDLIETFRCVVPVVLTLFDFLHKAFLTAGLIKTLVMLLSLRYIKEKNLPADIPVIVIKTLFLLCCRKHSSTTLEYLRDANAIPDLLKLCDSLNSVDCPLTTETQSILFHTLYVLTLLMENQNDIQIEHSKMSFYVVETIYQRIINPLNIDSLIDNRLKVAVSNFAWEIIVRNKQNVYNFLSCGMVFPSMDILEKTPHSVQLTYLSMLVDLCEYRQCVPYLITWRGRDGTRFLSLLCRIWRLEEERLHVLRGKGGCISDSERPLMGEEQYKLMKVNKDKIVSICDVFGSVRPKIYAIVQLYRRHEEVVKLCEEHYGLGRYPLPHEDLITLQLIEAYLPLKMGEIWWEMRHKQGEVLPLDRYLAESLADRYLNWSLSVQRAQLGLLLESESVLRGEEQQYYGLMRACQLTAALSALKEVVGVARSSDRQQLLLAHREFREHIEGSRAMLDTELRVAYPPDISLILVSNKTHGEASSLSQVPDCASSQGERSAILQDFPMSPEITSDSE